MIRVLICDAAAVVRGAMARLVEGDAGMLLAGDRTGAALALHYRWLEEPPRDDFLRRIARRRLTARERRNPERLRQEIDQLLGSAAIAA